MDYDYDVVIIGAGPVGGYTARLLCERGLSVLMVEEHNEVGRPFQCAGLVNPPAMQMVGLENTILQNFRKRFGIRMTFEFSAVSRFVTLVDFESNCC